MLLELLEVGGAEGSNDVGDDPAEFDSGGQGREVLGGREFSGRDRIFHHVDLILFGGEGEDFIMGEQDLSEQSLSDVAS